MKLLQTLYDAVLSPALLAAVLLAGVYCSLRLGYPFLRHPIRFWKDLICPPNQNNRLSSIKALTVALAGTLGVGNIAGVASAIAVGGPGAIFWMWVGALLSLLIKYAEVVLAIRYRKPCEGGYHGGAMYYMKRPAAKLIFSMLCLLASFALGNIMQANTVAATFENAFDLHPFLCGGLLSLLLYLAICKGFSRISTVTLYLVPLMSALYVGICLFAISQRIGALPAVTALILRSAFSPAAMLGGAGGFALARCIQAGISRGLITHEAGCGTAPMAHAEADTDSPVRQGFLGIFEVFADTMILCTLTAYTLLLHTDCLQGENGMEWVIASFSTSLGRMAGPLLAFLIFFFAIATMIGWSHYGLTALDYLSQRIPRCKQYKKLYATAYSLMAMIGSVTSPGAMWLLADYSVALMTLLHLPDLLAKLPEVILLTRNYFRQSARSLENTLAPDADSAKSKDLRDMP